MCETTNWFRVYGKKKKKAKIYEANINISCPRRYPFEKRKIYSVLCKRVAQAFILADLREVQVSELETGTYTNAQIADHYKQSPDTLLLLLMHVQKMGSEAQKRSILSYAVDLDQNKG